MFGSASGWLIVEIPCDPRRDPSPTAGVMFEAGNLQGKTGPVPSDMIRMHTILMAARH